MHKQTALWTPASVGVFSFLVTFSSSFGSDQLTICSVHMCKNQLARGKCGTTSSWKENLIVLSGGGDQNRLN